MATVCLANRGDALLGFSDADSVSAQLGVRWLEIYSAAHD